MTASRSSLLELAADCDANCIRLFPGRDGGLTIDAPRGALTPDLLGRLKAYKADVLALLLGAKELEVAGAPTVEHAAAFDQTINAEPVCPCGSTTWRDVPIHDGQSLRRDCGECGRFLEWPIWYGPRREVKNRIDQKATPNG